jgi:adenine-specific DNA-methyltransferase
VKKLTAQDPEAQSTDIVAENIDQIKSLFPEAFTEGRIDFEVFKQLLGASVDDREEKYGLNWNGKRSARQLALTPSTGTLRPCPDESVNWDTTRNIMIEGDNLEVLKLLQKSYTGKVKLIYIDPPYNTGKDFVYPDNFQDSIRNYLELTGQVEGGKKISSNTEASGRFHTDWLNMMYPRLKLARNLLRDDGGIFISIDDCEVSNARKLCDEIFGEENFAGAILWKKKTNGNNMGVIPPVHDYIVCYGKVLQESTIIGVPVSNEYLDSEYSNPDNDSRGSWTTSDLSANHEGPYFGIVNPKNGDVNYPANGRYWVFSEQEVLKRIEDGRIIFGKSGNAKPVQKKFLAERASLRRKVESWWDNHGYNEDGTSEIGELLTTKVFSHTKPSKLIRHIIDVATVENDLILDFFAGSGTTGHAVIAQNAADRGTRRYILVQIPEPLNPDNKDQKTAADYCDQLGTPRTIAELTKERLRRAAAKIKADHPDWSGDTGFRVFKLDSSNIRDWDPNSEDLEQSLRDHIEHIKMDRTENDILYELLLKLGLDLCVPIEKRIIAGKAVHGIGGGVLIVCLAETITREEVESLAQGIVDWHKKLAPTGETTIIFRDSSFANDVVKANLVAIFEQSGIKNLRSL